MEDGREGERKGGREGRKERTRGTANTREPRGGPPVTPPPLGPGVSSRETTHRESTYAHLALLLHQSTALHHVGFSVTGARRRYLSSEMPSRREGCLGERATPRAHRRTTHTDAPRTHTPPRAREAATLF